MIDLTKDELQTLIAVIDTSVRVEGANLNRAGANGLRQGRVGLLNARFVSTMSALAKIEDELGVIGRAEAAAKVVPEKAAETVKAKPKRVRAK